MRGIETLGIKAYYDLAEGRPRPPHIEINSATAPI
jgi:hypothetical protein